MPSPQTLSEADRRIVAVWAAVEDEAPAGKLPIGDSYLVAPRLRPQGLESEPGVGSGSLGIEEALLERALGKELCHPPSEGLKEVGRERNRDGRLHSFESRCRLRRNMPPAPSRNPHDLPKLAKGAPPQPQAAAARWQQARIWSGVVKMDLTWRCTNHVAADPLDLNGSG